jgi:hypothetical protein
MSLYMKRSCRNSSLERNGYFYFFKGLEFGIIFKVVFRGLTTEF